MGLFGDKKKHDLPPLFAESELELAIGYDAVIDYLQGLSDEEYDKVIKVAGIYRSANADACAALGVANEPTTFIKPAEPELVPAQVNHPTPKSILDEDDDLSAAFLEDEPKKKVDGVKGRKVTVKSK